jgi:acetyltransferase-like isoleucine patch superfamily enzyme
VTVLEGSRSSLVIGRHCAVGDDVVISLRGGRLVVGSGVDVRRNCQVEVAGHCEFTGPALVQPGTTVHCDESVVVGARAVLSEGVTVVDSSHGNAVGEPWFVDVVHTAPVVIEDGVWVGAKATIARGVTIGAGSVVSANSLVIGDVPTGWLVSGVPADRVRPLPGAIGSASALSGNLRVP